MRGALSRDGLIASAPGPRPALAGGTRAALDGLVGQMRGHLFVWTPVVLACGIALWFALPIEPDLGFYLAVGMLALGATLVWRWGAEMLQPLAVCLLCLCAGMLAAGARAHLVSAPMLEFRYYGPVTGRIIGIDRSQSDKIRLTLDRVTLDRTPPGRTPERVRISLHGDQRWLTPQPGQIVMATAHLAAPEGAVEPGGFDFRRMAFFDRLGAVGYTSSPLLLWQEAEPGSQRIDRLRAWLSGAMLAAMPGQAGAFATGAMTGDRSAITEETAQALRDSSLAHILAISGMNMAFLVAFVFGLFRYGLALVPPVALRVNTKKLAAAISLAAAGFYLALSGANVATQRAFLMVTVMLVAVLCDRRAMSMRSIAISALLLLVWQPESLLEPGFQMSFAATVALVAGFSALDRGVWRRSPLWLRPVITAVLSSAIGGVATAPYAAAHFNRFADLGFLANLLTVPVMGLLIMPGGVLAALLAPFGLVAPALWMMEAGAAWILLVAHRVAAVEGAVTGIPAPPDWALPVLTLAVLWLILVPHRQLRGAALLPVVVAVAGWATGGARPDLLISADGAVAGLAGAGGRAVSAPAGAGFVVDNWLQNDGDLAPRDLAAARPGFSGPRSARVFVLNGWSGVILTGKGAEAAVDSACLAHDLVIAGGVRRTGMKDATSDATCLLLDADYLRRSGPVAILAEGGGLRLIPSRGHARLWLGHIPVATEDFIAQPAAQGR